MAWVRDPAQTQDVSGLPDLSLRDTSASRFSFALLAACRPLCSLGFSFLRMLVHGGHRGLCAACESPVQPALGLGHPHVDGSASALPARAAAPQRPRPAPRHRVGPAHPRVPGCGIGHQLCWSYGPCQRAFDSVWAWGAVVRCIYFKGSLLRQFSPAAGNLGRSRKYENQEQSQPREWNRALPPRAQNKAARTHLCPR